MMEVTLTQQLELGKQTVSRWNHVDLAGTGATGHNGATTTKQQRLEESAINSSLQVLARVIGQLCKPATSTAEAALPSAVATTDGGGSSSRGHVPYRESALTWLLKNALGGNAKTVLVVTLDPSAACFDESMATLRFAEQANQVVNRAVVNTIAVAVVDNSSQMKAATVRADRRASLAASLKEKRAAALNARVAAANRTINAATESDSVAVDAADSAVASPHGRAALQDDRTALAVGVGATDKVADVNGGRDAGAAAVDGGDAVKSSGIVVEGTVTSNSPLDDPTPAASSSSPSQRRATMGEKRLRIAKLKAERNALGESEQLLTRPRVGSRGRTADVAGSVVEVEAPTVAIAPELPVVIGSKVRLEKVGHPNHGMEGVARYGPAAVDFTAGYWVGIELATPVGKHDGVVKGKRYFSCPPNCGIFAKESMVVAVDVTAPAGLLAPTGLPSFEALAQVVAKTAPRRDPAAIAQPAQAQLAPNSSSSASESGEDESLMGATPWNPADAGVTGTAESAAKDEAVGALVASVTGEEQQGEGDVGEDIDGSSSESDDDQSGEDDSLMGATPWNPADAGVTGTAESAAKDEAAAGCKEGDRRNRAGEVREGVREEAVATSDGSPLLVDDGLSSQPGLMQTGAAQVAAAQVTAHVTAAQVSVAQATAAQVDATHVDATHVGATPWGGAMHGSATLSFPSAANPFASDLEGINPFLGIVSAAEVTKATDVGSEPGSHGARRQVEPQVMHYNPFAIDGGAAASTTSSQRMQEPAGPLEQASPEASEHYNPFVNDAADPDPTPNPNPDLDPDPAAVWLAAANHRTPASTEKGMLPLTTAAASAAGAPASTNPFLQEASAEPNPFLARHSRDNATSPLSFDDHSSISSGSSTLAWLSTATSVEAAAVVGTATTAAHLHPPTVTLEPTALRPTHVAGYPYVPREEDELSLQKGDLICVHTHGIDGWFTGTNLSTTLLGTFPGNFVVAIDDANAATGHTRSSIPLEQQQQQQQHTLTSSSLYAASQLAEAEREAEKAMQRLALARQHHLADNRIARPLQQHDSIASGRSQREEILDYTHMQRRRQTQQQQQQQQQRRQKMQQQRQSAVQQALTGAGPRKTGGSEAGSGGGQRQRGLVMPTGRELTAGFEGTGEHDFEGPYSLRFIGSEEVVPSRGLTPATINAVITSLLSARKQLKIKNSSIFEMRVHAIGIRLTDKGTTTKKSAKALQKAAAAPHRVGGAVTYYPSAAICTTMYYPQNPKIFGFITLMGSGYQKKVACHVFEHHKSAVAVVNAIERSRKW
jgi:hypothetical protein